MGEFQRVKFSMIFCPKASFAPWTKCRLGFGHNFSYTRLV